MNKVAFVYLRLSSVKEVILLGSVYVTEKLRYGQNPLPIQAADKHRMIVERWVNVGPTSLTLDQHSTSVWQLSGSVTLTRDSPECS